VLADQNSQRNVKKTLRLQKDAQENTTDVQEDVWEKHAELVQELLVQQRKLKEQNWKNAEEPTEEVAEDSIAEEPSEKNAEEKEEKKENTREKSKEKSKKNTEEKRENTKRKKRKFTKEKKKLLCSKRSFLKRNWKLTAEEKQKEDVEKTKNAELE